MTARSAEAFALRRGGYFQSPIHELTNSPTYLSPFWQCEREDQIAAAAAAFAAARRHRDELLAVHHVHRGRREDAGAGVELPQQRAGLRVVREQIAGGVAAGTDEH